MRCDLCGGDCVSRGSYSILGKYEAHIAQCQECAYAFAVEPSWLEEAYSSPMTAVDMGPLHRCIEQARPARMLMEVLYRGRGRGLDFGAGYGLFVRRMRDLGYQFFWHDTHCPNLFARGFEGDLKESEHYQMITAFEVMEHLVSPNALLKSILSSSDSFLFSTMLLPEPFPSFDEWWYFGPEHGQHVSFYSRRTLRRLAETMGKRFVTNGFNLHMITSSRINRRLFEVVTNATIAALFELVWRRDSLLMSDFEAGRSAALEEISKQKMTPPPFAPARPEAYEADR